MSDPVDDLLELIERRRPLFTSRPEALARELAAGGLTYAERLLRGIRALKQADLADVSGGPIRTVWECWCVGNYLLLKSDEAAKHVADYYRFRARQISKAWPVEEGEEHPFEDLIDPEAPAIGFNLRDIAAEVEELVRAEERRAGLEVTNEISSYDTLYKYESTAASHGGLGSFGRYVAPVPEPEVTTRRDFRPEDVERFDVSVEWARRVEMADGGVLVAALWVGLLARAVFHAFGIGGSDLEAILERLNAAASDTAPPARE